MKKHSEDFRVDLALTIMVGMLVAFYVLTMLFK
jgi:hypothetical protein